MTLNIVSNVVRPARVSFGQHSRALSCEIDGQRKGQPRRSSSEQSSTLGRRIVHSSSFLHNNVKGIVALLPCYVSMRKVSSFFQPAMKFSTKTSHEADPERKALAGQRKPLEGCRVIECGHMVAGPFAGTVLGYFGAEVIKVEPYGGDQIRDWRVLDESGTSLWWYSLGRNKKSVCLDLSKPEAREIVKRLVTTADVLIENFRPGVMEKWGLGPEELKKLNKRLIYTRVSGYGQSGPYAKRPGFASVCEAMGGFRYVNGFPDRPPVRPNLSMGDTVAGLHAVIGITMALLARNGAKQWKFGTDPAPGGTRIAMNELDSRSNTQHGETCGRRNPTGVADNQVRNVGAGGTDEGAEEGQVVDVAIYESMFNLLEATVAEYSYNGTIREPSGSTINGIVPSNLYCCSDGKYVVIGANKDSLYKKLMGDIVGRRDLAEDPKLATNDGRVENVDKIDEAIGSWTLTLSSTQVCEVLNKASIPVGLIYNVKDMYADPQFQARGMFEEVNLQIPNVKSGRAERMSVSSPVEEGIEGGKLGENENEKGQDSEEAAQADTDQEEKEPETDIRKASLKLPAILPKLERTPGSTEWAGPRLGQHNREVLLDMLKLEPENAERLVEEGIVGGEW